MTEQVSDDVAVEAGVLDTPAEPAVEEVEPTLEEQLALAEATAAEYLDHARRVTAEFANFRRRAAEDQAAAAHRGMVRLVTDLLPVLDDLERALQLVEAEEQDGLAEGVAITFRSLRSVLEKHGLTSVDPLGQGFDPHHHEALMEAPSSEVAEGHVMQVLQPGYRLGDRVVRPARVIVSSGG